MILEYCDRGNLDRAIMQKTFMQDGRPNLVRLAPVAVHYSLTSRVSICTGQLQQYLPGWCWVFYAGLYS